MGEVGHYLTGKQTLHLTQTHLKVNKSHPHTYISTKTQIQATQTDSFNGTCQKYQFYITLYNLVVVVITLNKFHYTFY